MRLTCRHLFDLNKRHADIRKGGFKGAAFLTESPRKAFDQARKRIDGERCCFKVWRARRKVDCRQFIQSNRMVGDDGFNGCFSYPRPGLLQFTIEFRVIVVGCWLAEVVGFVTHAR